MSPLADATRLLFALHWRTAHGPPAFFRRLREAFSRRLPTVDLDYRAKGDEQLRALLAPLPEKEQRRLVYNVTRKVAGPVEVFDLWAPPQELDRYLSSDNSFWYGIASAAISAAERDPVLAHRAMCARGILAFGRGKSRPRAALAELLAPYDDRAGWVREAMGCLVSDDDEMLRLRALDKEPPR